MKRYFLAAILPLLLLLLPGSVQAGTGAPVIQVLDGSLNQLSKDSMVTVTDSAFFNAAYNSILVKPYQVLNYVTLKINESSVYYLQSAFTATVRLRIDATQANGSVVTVDTSLTVNYRPDSVYTNRSTYRFRNGYKVVVKVLSVATNASWNVWNALAVENQLQPFPVFTFTQDGNVIQSVTAGSLAYTTGADELPVSWGTVLQADKYDLEWTYVDSAALASGSYNTNNAPDPALIFDNNASRVTVTGTQYNIPLLYDGAGSLFFRVRPVQEPGPGLRKEAFWSSNYLAMGGLGRFNYAGHQRNLNWQSTISFAEEGKRKAVVQYFDGSLRSRQTVTKDNTTNTTIVAETVYDYQGRPVIQVLPAPTLSSILAYTPNFNLGGINGLAYDQASFDNLPDPGAYCSASADSMRSSSGAANYYSPNNPLKEVLYNQFIPDAKGFPYTETTYTQDNTGRIRSQGGVGPNHRIGSGHETRYFYGSPDQKELDLLFGTDAGDRSHYFKTMVRDANGQYSVSYTDLHGRTVATALAGTLPDSIRLDTLKNKVSAIVTETLADPGSAVIKDLVMESKKGLLVPLAGNHTFTYRLNPQSLQLNDCSNTPVCYDCLYDLEIVITDDCNNQKLPNGKAFDTVLHNFSLIDTTCANPAAGFSFSFTQFLQEGSYDVTKKLSVSRRGMNYYRDTLFTRRNTCQTASTFVLQQQQLQATITQCRPSCQSCLNSLGTYPVFRDRYLQSAGINPADSALYRPQVAQAYQQAQTDCNLLCNSNTETDNVQNAMLLDLTPPSGQYANTDSTLDVYSIFYTKYDASGNATVLPPYARASGYLDGDGKPDSVYDEASATLLVPEQLTPEAFAAKFKASWAKTLLPFHPEYCKLQKYLQYNASSAWDKQFEATDTYAEALSKGYLNPLLLTGASYTRFNGGSAAQPDPLPAMVGGSFLTNFQNALVNYTASGTNTSGTSFSLWALASATVKYGPQGTAAYTTARMTTDSAFQKMCTGDLDMAWRTFRQMYLDVKRNLLEKELNTNVCPSAATPAMLVAAHRQPNFTDYTQSLANYGLSVPTNTTQSAAAQQAAANSLYANQANNCIAYAAYWFQQLKACNYTAADSAAIIPQLVQVCQKGSDVSHPYGSSSIAPDSSNTYKSFQDVIQAYNAAHNITNIYCNAYGITAPKPYNAQAPNSSQPLYTKPDSCSCNKINQLYARYLAVRFSYSSFASYLQQVFNTVVSPADLTTLLAQCTTANVPNPCTYSSTPLQLPPLFQCSSGDVCITCQQFKTNDNQFKALYPGITPLADSLTADTVQLTKNQLYAAYMNYQLGFVKTSNDYLLFRSSCTARLAQDSLNALSDTCNRYTYVKTYGGAGVDLLSTVQQTLDGGFILAGHTTSFGNGGRDGYVVKTDKKGNVQWSKTYGGTENDELGKIVQTRDSGYIAIGTTRSFHQLQGEVYVVKLKPGGEVSWSLGLGLGSTYGEQGMEIIQTTDGGYALSAAYNLSGGVSEVEVVRLSNTGGVLWGRKFGGTSSDVAGSIAEDADTLVVGGFTVSSGVNTTGGTQVPSTNYDALLVKLNKSNGNLVWGKTYDVGGRSNWGLRFSKTAQGYRIDCLNTNSFSSLDNPVSCVLDLDRNGGLVRGRELPVISSGLGYLSSAASVDGGYVLTQTVTDAAHADAYLYQVNSAGAISWTNQVKRSGTQYLYPVVQLRDSSFAGAGADGDDALFLKTNRQGKTNCGDTALSGASTQPSVTVYTVNFPNSALSFSNTAVSVQGYAAATVQTEVCTLEPCGQAGEGPVLCGRHAPVLPAVVVDSISNCSDSTFFAVSAGTELYTVYRDSLNNLFDSVYRRQCLQAYRMESFTVSHAVSEYQYTLYYYDQSGSLVRTVPPAGVDLSRLGWQQSWSDSVVAARNAGTVLVPRHVLATDYRYNTLGQVLAQQTPDGGMSRFWYDRLGRLSLSQNARQQSASAVETGRQYSYTLYDALGRITEVGQLSNTGSTSMTDSISRRPSLLSGWLTASAASKEQVTQTVYDMGYAGFSGLPAAPLVQRNLRNRVSYTSFTNGSNPAQYNQASFFSYDVLGNADTLVQDYGASDLAATQNVMNSNGHRFKKLVYQFDLVSGKVNMLLYQPGQLDALYHRYSYDAENRLTQAETSSDSVHWEKDARYQYYKHGPLAREVLGHQQVQGLDYAYTVQGWQKGLNSLSLQSVNDMGRDGDTSSLNRYVGQDVLGYGLGYFTGDYTPVSVSVAGTPFPGYSAYMGGLYKPLYNGNISTLAVNIGALNGAQLNAYTYDQLHRLTGMDVLTGLDAGANSWSGAVAGPAYLERVGYDVNGNISRYQRNGSAGLPAMDSLNYQYQPGTNRLDHVNDAVSASNYAADLDDQPPGNYGYDATGNLVSDQQAGISSIRWTVYGKIQSISKTDGTQLRYSYDASGNRISKEVTVSSGSSTYTWYVRDGQGNVVCTYSSAGTGSSYSSYTLSLQEQFLYGISRLGLYGRLLNLKTAVASGSVLNYQRGNKSYELANHLGNVLSVISDRKQGISVDGFRVQNYRAVVGEARDYYPFGMEQPGRTGYGLAGGGLGIGDTGINGYTLPGTLRVSSRSGNAPSSYVAGHRIDFTEGFVSGVSDGFEAYIADNSYAGTGNGGTPPVSEGNGYRYGFNGQERSDEIDPNGNSMTAEFWQYDARIGRRWNLDLKPTVGLSYYSAFSNNPINNFDPKGDTPRVSTRIFGALKTLGGTVEVAAGALLGATTGWTGAGAVVGGAGVVHGADVASSGINQLLTGEDASSFTHKGIQTGLEVAGVSPATANTVAGGLDAMLSIGLTAGAAAYPKPLPGVPVGPRVAGPAAEVGEQAAKGGVQAAEYTFTKSAGKHLTEIVTKGANKGQLARPYMNSPLTIQEIMSTGKGTLDATFKGGMNWKVPGTFRGSQGFYELGINPNTNVIYHFNFVH